VDALSWKCFSTERSWAWRPTQGDEKRLLFSNLLSLEAPPYPFVIPTGAVAQWRDLCVDALSWKCFSTERTRIPVTRRQTNPRVRLSSRKAAWGLPAPTTSTGIRGSVVEGSAFRPSHYQLLRAATPLPFVIPSVPRVPVTQAPDMIACAAFCKESRMKLVSAIELDRNPGVAEGSAVRPSPKQRPRK
jgi:hypothetical protein